MNRFMKALPGLLLAGAALSLPSTASAGGAPTCTNADLHVTLHARGAAAGSAYVALRYTNVSDHGCRTGGFGGLSFVGHGDGTQLGSPAARAAGTPVRSFVLRPGQRATSLVQIANALNFPKRECRPTRPTASGSMCRTHAPASSSRTGRWRARGHWVAGTAGSN